MRAISEQELKDILEKHGKWLRSEDGGSRANLSRARLSRADLSGADLSRADLSGADLSRANLFGANLYGANLYGADLSGADLSRANLFGANLYGADLYGADLSRANLSGANLSRANLSETLLANKAIHSFQFQKHQAYFIGTDEIVIGCHRKPIKEWVDNFEAIGKSESYTDEQIKRYGEFILMCANIFESEKQ